MALYRDDSLVLSDGDEVSVDSIDPEGTFWAPNPNPTLTLAPTLTR